MFDPEKRPEVASNDEPKARALCKWLDLHCEVPRQSEDPRGDREARSVFRRATILEALGELEEEEEEGEEEEEEGMQMGGEALGKAQAMAKGEEASEEGSLQEQGRCCRKQEDEDGKLMMKKKGRRGAGGRARVSPKPSCSSRPQIGRAHV